jgi:hypothetical protein
MSSRFIQRSRSDFELFGFTVFSFGRKAFGVLIKANVIRYEWANHGLVANNIVS